MLVLGVALIIALSGPDPLDPMRGANPTIASANPVSLPTDSPGTPATQAPSQPAADADAADAGPTDAGDARIADAAPTDAQVPDAAPSTVAPIAARRPLKPRPPKPKPRPRIAVKTPPSAPPSATPPTQAAAPATAVARSVGGYDVTPKVNPTSADLAKARQAYNRGVDAHKRGAPKSALRFLVRSLKAGLQGKDARDATRRIKQIVDRATLEGQTF